MKRIGGNADRLKKRAGHGYKLQYKGGAAWFSDLNDRMELMATNRLEVLGQMVAQDPQNTFARYGLAMELANNGQLQQAVHEYRTVLDQDENYAAAYYHGGQALEQLGEVEQARTLYEKGVEATTRKGDAHTRAEIEAALSLLPI